MATCEEIVREYVGAVESAIACVTLPDGKVLIDTPYTYADGDVVQIGAERIGDLIRLSDYGFALSRLEMQGVNVDAQQVRKGLAEIVRSYRVDLADDELRIDVRANSVGTAFMRLVGALREVGALQYLRPQSRPPVFERRVLTFLRSVTADVTEKPDVVGVSGTSYRLTARLRRPDAREGEPADVLAQAVSGGRSPTGLRAVNYAYRAFNDINGDRPASSKLVVLSDEAGNWRAEDIRILATVAYVGGWWERDRLVTFIGGEVPDTRRLFPHQTDLKP